MSRARVGAVLVPLGLAWSVIASRECPSFDGQASVETMADMLHALMSFDVLETLIDQRGWSIDDFAAHLARVTVDVHTTGRAE